VDFSFYKYHGSGNDFILFDNRSGEIKPENTWIQRLCHRRFGIGADGVILLEPAPGFDFGMRYYNADGNESTMCGNGGRCIAAFADFLSLPGKQYRFVAVDGPHTAIILSSDDNLYRVKLSIKDVKIPEVKGPDYILDTGSPHYVTFMPDIIDMNVKELGRAIRNRPEFGQAGINANFVAPSQDGIFVRTYERGVEDETLSCGTGVTASALAYALSRGLKTGAVDIRTLGGELRVHFNYEEGIFTDIFLEGPAQKVFEGIVHI